MLLMEAITFHLVIRFSTFHPVSGDSEMKTDNFTDSHCLQNVAPYKKMPRCYKMTSMWGIVKVGGPSDENNC